MITTQNFNDYVRIEFNRDNGVTAVVLELPERRNAGMPSTVKLPMCSVPLLSASKQSRPAAWRCCTALKREENPR
jgi:1,4-dihydroxy-2-naphthoyl-CoA synthase